KLGLTAPEATTTVSHSTMIYCADVDDVYQRAIKAGAAPMQEPATFVTGDRFGVVMDPFGHRWAIMTRVEDVPADEAERRGREWLASPADQADTPKGGLSPAGPGSKTSSLAPPPPPPHSPPPPRKPQ